MNPSACIAATCLGLSFPVDDVAPLIARKIFRHTSARLEVLAQESSATLSIMSRLPKRNLLPFPSRPPVDSLSPTNPIDHRIVTPGAKKTIEQEIRVQPPCTLTSRFRLIYFYKSRFSRRFSHRKCADSARKDPNLRASSGLKCADSARKHDRTVGNRAGNCDAPRHVLFT